MHYSTQLDQYTLLWNPLNHSIGGKKSDKYWSGRTDGNTWTIIKKNQEKINDIVPVKIIDARGVTLFGNCLTKEELLYETN